MRYSVVAVCRGTLALALLTALFSCASAPSPSISRNSAARESASLAGKNDQAPVTPSAASGGQGTVLTVPARDQLNRNAIDPQILRALEQGGPTKLRSAVAMVRSLSTELTEPNKVVLAIAGELMNILYPLEQIDWEIPALSDAVAYIGAVRSARMGVYDYNTGNTDYLSLVLPSLIMVLSPAGGDYYTDARISLEKALSLNKESILAPYFLALLDERQKNTDAALAAYKKIWDIDKSCYPAGSAYARLLLEKGEARQSFAIAAALSAQYPASPAFQEMCAVSAFSYSDWEAADPYIIEILRREPTNTRFLLMRARILVERKDYLKANSLLDAYATTNRTDKTYMLLRSRVMREWNRNPASAAGIMEEALRLYPGEIDVLLTAAELSFQTGQAINRQSGRELVQLVLERESNNRLALVLLTTDFIAKGEWTAAISRGEQLLNLFPQDENRILLARCYLGAGQNRNAINQLRPLYQKSSPSDEVVALYLEALVAAGEQSLARTLIASRMGESSSALRSVFYYFESKLTVDEEGQASALRSSLLSDPRNSRALFAMYEWNFNKKDYRRALYYLKQTIALDPGNRSLQQKQSELELLLAP